MCVLQITAPCNRASLGTSVRGYYVLIFVQICIAAEGLSYRSFIGRTLKNCLIGLDSSLGLCSAHAGSINPLHPLDPRPITCVAHKEFSKTSDTSPEKSEATQWVQNSHAMKLDILANLITGLLNLLWDVIRKWCPGWSSRGLPVIQTARFNLPGGLQIIL